MFHQDFRHGFAHFQELVVAFGGYVSVYISQFVNLVKRILEEEKERMAMSLDMATLMALKEGQRPHGTS